MISWLSFFAALELNQRWRLSFTPAVAMLLAAFAQFCGLEQTPTPALVIFELCLAAGFLLSHAYACEQEDRALGWLVLRNSSVLHYYISKCLSLVAHLTVAALSLGLVHPSAGGSGLLPLPLGVTLLSVAGLAFLGTLLGALTMHADRSTYVTALLFFPLVTPLTLASVHASTPSKDALSLGDPGWLALLAGFDMILLALGILLFDSLVDRDPL